MRKKQYLLFLLGALLLVCFWLDHFEVSVYFLSMHSFVYNVTLLLGALLGMFTYKSLDEVQKKITLLFAGVFLFEFSSLILLEIQLISPWFYNALLLFLLLIHYAIFKSFLNVKKAAENVLQWSTILCGLVLIMIMFASRITGGFPFINVSIYCIYVITFSLLCLFKILETPLEIKLWRTPQFLFSSATLVMYSLKFWNVSFRPVLHKLPMEVMLKYKFFLFNLSNYTMETAYCIIMLILFLPSNNKNDLRPGLNQQ